LRRAEICSNDPICADHEPEGHTADDATHGAACHGCLLVAETSCEARNLLLDRALLVETMSGAKAPLFFREAITCRRYSLRVAAAHHPDCGIAPDYDREDQFPIPIEASSDLIAQPGGISPQIGTDRGLRVWVARPRSWPTSHRLIEEGPNDRKDSNPAHSSPGH
jgi:hypothetical protein